MKVRADERKLHTLTIDNIFTNNSSPDKIRMNTDLKMWNQSLTLKGPPKTQE